MLKRAVSTVYYAMFHALCLSNANIVAGLSTDPQTRESWTRTYRSLDHGPAKERMARDKGIVEPAVHQFATVFAILQQQRQLADYDPHSRFSRRQVINLIGFAETATEDLMATSLAVRRPLATLVLLRER